MRKWRDTRLIGLLLSTTLLTSLFVAVPAGALTSAASVATSPLTLGSQGATLGYAQLGLAQNYTFTGNGSAVGLKIPVPQGLQQTMLDGTLTIPANFGAGSVVVESGTSVISSYPLPATSAQEQQLSFFADIADAPVSAGHAAFTLVLQQAGPVGTAQSSTTCGSTLPLSLSNLSVTYAGSVATPTSVSDFFPPVLNKLTIYVPDAPTTSEETAALNIALGAARSYKLVPVDISVAGWNGETMPPPPTGALDRAVVIASSDTAGLRLGGSTDGNQVLVVSGNASSLPAQTSLLTSTVLPVVQTPSASVIKTLTANPSVPTDVTFSQLGVGGTSTFVGQQQLSIPIDATKFGGVASSLAVDLKANYTPLGSDEKGSIQASVDGVVLANQAFGQGGSINLGLTIPQQLISRTTDLLLAVTYYPTNFTCGSSGRAMTFTVDPRSTVTASLESGGSGGFANLPQSLFPTVQVAFDHAAIPELSAAASTLCGFQRLSPVLIRPEVVSLSTAKASGQPLLVVGSSAALQADFDPPLAAKGHGVFTVNGKTYGTFAQPADIASIQAFADQNRSVVMVSTSGSWSMVDQLLGHLGDTESKWAALTGDVVAIGAQGRVVDVSIRSGGAQVFTATTKNYTLYIGIAVVFVLALVGLALWELLRIRRRRARRAVVTEESS